VQDDRVVADPQQAEAFTAVPGELRDRGLAAALQGLAEQDVRFGGDRAVGLQVIPLADPERIDRLVRHERRDLGPVLPKLPRSDK
jgi:hypothetical protein